VRGDESGSVLESKEPGGALEPPRNSYATSSCLILNQSLDHSAIRATPRLYLVT
jgi:hypothetical protein